MKKLQLLIPTFNRASDLIFNLNLLASEIRSAQASTLIGIIISDNASPDSTQSDVEQWQTHNPDIDLMYFRQTHNVGLEPNSVKALELSDSEYIMFIGDDDFLSTDYLSYCLEQIQNNENIGCIIPKRITIHPREKTNLPPIPAGKEEKFEKGFKSMLQNSVNGHQLTGIVMKSKDLLKDYLSFPEYRNPYLFIYFTARCLYLYDSIKNTQYVTYISEGNPKDWSYDDEGLLSEVYKSFYPFLTTLGEAKVVDLIEKITLMQYFRLGITLGSPFRSWKRLQNLLTKIKPISGVHTRLKKAFIKIYLDLWLQKIGLR